MLLSKIFERNDKNVSDPSVYFSFSICKVPSVQFQTKRLVI